MEYEYYTEYSFEKEHEEKCFNIIETLAQKFHHIRTKIQYNPHDFGTYKSIVIKYWYDDDDDEEYDDDYVHPWLDECNELEKLIQENPQLKPYL